MSCGLLLLRVTFFHRLARVLLRAGEIGEVGWWGAVVSALSAMDAYRVMLRALCRGCPLYGAGMNLASRV